MAPKPFPFFFYYYLKKISGSKIPALDIFWKRFFRMSKKLHGRIVKEEDKEICYQSNINSKQTQLYIRTKGSSDIQVFSQVFKENEYQPLIEEVHKKNKQASIHFIVDAGANVGYTSVLMKQFFPEAFLLVIEPDNDNTLQIRKNFEGNHLQHYDILESGIWSKDCWLNLKKDSDNGKEWSFYVTESEHPTQLKAHSLATIIKKYPYPFIDILKIDIEGSETEIFKNKSEISNILQRTRFLAIEIHDALADRNYILSILKENNFNWFEHSELTIATNQSLLNEVILNEFV